MSNCSSISRSSSLIWSDCCGAVPVVVVFVGIARVFPSPDLKLLSITGETYTSITKKKTFDFSSNDIEKKKGISIKKTYRVFFVIKIIRMFFNPSIMI